MTFSCLLRVVVPKISRNLNNIDIDIFANKKRASKLNNDDILNYEEKEDGRNSTLDKSTKKLLRDEVDITRKLSYLFD